MRDFVRFKLNPIYWPLWIIFLLLRLLVLLPYRVHLFLGRSLGRVLILFPSRSKDTAKTNLALCFPDKTDEERLLLLKKNYESVGVFIFEVMLAFWGSARKLSRLKFHIEPDEWAIYQNAIARGKGVLIAGPHFMPLEVCGRLFSMREPFVAMYRRNKSPFLEHLLRPSLERYYCEVVERAEVKKLYDVLAKNLSVWYAADVDMGERRSVFVPFFGIQTATMTAPARIVQKTGASLIVIAFFRHEDKRGYQVRISAMPEGYPTGDEHQDAILLNTVLEKYIRDCPEQYFWQYKRFKTRPEGEARFYGVKSD